MSQIVRFVIVALVAFGALASMPAHAANAMLRDMVCPGKPISLTRLGQEYTVQIDRASLTQSAAVLKLQRPNRKEEFYTLHTTSEKAIATGGSVLRFKPSHDKDSCFEVL